MNCKASSLPYSQTGFYSNIVLNYLRGAEGLRDFYKHKPEPGAVEGAIKSRGGYPVKRKELADALFTQYKGLNITSGVANNIDLLRSDNTYTITTAHQPNIFTGPLYFIYKILHVVKLAQYCKEKFPEYNFVPVYYMGSEDADLDELGHIFLNNEKLEWNTKQTGAVGRMTIDEPLLQLIARIESEIDVLPHGLDIAAAIKKFYSIGQSIQDATLGFVNHLFGNYGLVILVPDTPALKSIAIPVFKDELLRQNSSAIVSKTAETLIEKGYKPQAHGRDINLFYLTNYSRLRIERDDANWKVVDTDIVFNEEQLLKELQEHPERFSPNVILRGLFQEMILPNIIFVGGGGELAYWLELKDVFEFYKVPYPMLVLRNSFLIITKQQAGKLQKLGLTPTDSFKNIKTLQDEWVHQNSNKKYSVGGANSELNVVYDALKQQASEIDITLLKHIEALRKRTIDKIEALGKKMLRAEKRNHTDAMRQLEKIKVQLFPNNNLQERVDNMVPYYAQWGNHFIDDLYRHSLAFEQQFVILTEGD